MRGTKTKFLKALFVFDDRKAKIYCAYGKLENQSIFFFKKYENQDILYVQNFLSKMRRKVRICILFN